MNEFSSLSEEKQARTYSVPVYKVALREKEQAAMKEETIPGYFREQLPEDGLSVHLDGLSEILGHVRSLFYAFECFAKDDVALAEEEIEDLAILGKRLCEEAEYRSKNLYQAGCLWQEKAGVRSEKKTNNKREED